MKRGHSLKDSFNFAISGVIEALKTEKHMKIHAVITLIMLILSSVYNITKFEQIIVILVIALVWITELLNTAIETTVDIHCKTYNELAKKAKDVAAGAVLIAAINSVVVGYIIFNDKLDDEIKWTFKVVRESERHLLSIILSLIVILVVVIKSYYNKGTPLKGGMPSGHSAIAASLWITITFMTSNVKIFLLGFILMALVIQSRIEGKIHSLKETMIGALLGGAVTYLVLQLLLL